MLSPFCSLNDCRAIYISCFEASEYERFCASYRLPLPWEQEKAGGLSSLATAHV